MRITSQMMSSYINFENSSLSTMACQKQSDLNIKEIGKYSNL